MHVLVIIVNIDNMHGEKLKTLYHVCAPAEISGGIKPFDIWPVITTAATWHLKYLPSHSLFERE